MSSICNRESNVELLRIISMIFIVLGHFIGQSNYDITRGDFFVYFLRYGLRIAVNIFLIIGVYYMVDRKFSFERWLKLYFQMFLYSVLITCLCFIFTDVSLKHLIGSFFPFLTVKLWFVPAYLSLMLLAPFINPIFRVKRKTQETILLVTTFIFCIVASVHQEKSTFLADIAWFVYVYIFVGFLKNNNIFEEIYIRFSKKMFLFIGVGIYLILIGITYAKYKYNLEQLSVFEYMLFDIHCAPNLICAMSIFIWFKRQNIGSIPLINYVSRSALSVYLIHQVPVFYPILWNDIFIADSFITSKYFALYAIFVSVIVYILSVSIDYIRIATEPYYLGHMMSWLRSKNVVEYIDKRMNALF